MFQTILNFFSPPERPIGVSLVGLLLGSIPTVETLQIIVLSLTAIATIVGIWIQFCKIVDRYKKNHPDEEEDDD